MKLNELKQELEQLKEEARSFINEIEVQERSMNEEEELRFNEFKDKTAQLEESIRKQEEIDAFAAKITITEKQEPKNQIRMNQISHLEEAYRSGGKANITNEQLRSILTSNAGVVSTQANQHEFAPTKGVLFGNADVNFVNARQELTIVPEVDAAFIAEGAAGTVGDNTFAPIILSPKRVFFAEKISKQVLDMGGAEFENVIMQRVSESIRKGLETKFFSKDAAVANVSPAGIFTGTPTATAGAVPTGAELAAAYGEFGDKAGVDFDRAKWIVDPTTFAQLSIAGKSAGVTSEIVQNGSFLGIPVLQSNRLPKNLGAGTKKGIALVDFSDVKMYFFGGVDIMFDQYTLAHEGMVRVLVTVYADYAMPKGCAVVRQLA